eukprot:365725-Chlamydomonas_euryale.AAC.46
MDSGLCLRLQCRGSAGAPSGPAAAGSFQHHGNAPGRPCGGTCTNSARTCIPIRRQRGHSLDQCTCTPATSARTFVGNTPESTPCSAPPAHRSRLCKIPSLCAAPPGRPPRRPGTCCGPAAAAPPT